MKTYRVTVVFEIRETYKLKAENAEAATASWHEGERIDNRLDEYPLSRTVIHVREVLS